MQEASFRQYFPRRGAESASRTCEGLIRRFAPSIGHNHGLFDEL